MNGRVALAAILAVGFMVLIALAMFAKIAESSQRIVDGGIGALGVALGNAIQGLFRTDKTDETRANNTRDALGAIQSAIDANPPSPGPIGQ